MTASELDDFKLNGCTVVKNFCSPSEVKEMKEKMTKLVEKWDGSMKCTFSSETETQSKQQGSNDYFFESADKISFFLEPHAVDENTGSIKTGIEKLRAINKVGHGLHVKDPVFAEYSFSNKVKSLVKDLGYEDPVLPQSMYIMKNAVVGGEVTSHQDSSFLFTIPRLSCLGLWLALDDATLENGCLWAKLGSHKQPLVNRWCRKGGSDSQEMEFIQFLSEEDKNRINPLSGKTLQNLTETDLKNYGYTPLPCKAGDLVLIHGEVDHLSLPNTSEKPRHTFQLHLVEGPRNGVHWDKGNWLQYPKGKSFPSLLKEPSSNL